MPDLHPLLLSQLQQLQVEGTDLALAPAWHELLQKISASYDAYDKKLEEGILSVTADNFASFIKYMPAAVAVFDQQMRYVMVSDRWLADYHLTATTILGKSHYDIFPEILNMPEWLAAHQKGLQGQESSQESYKWIMPNGKVLWLKWSIHPWKQKDGTIGGIIIFSEDITQQKQIQQRFTIQYQMTRIFSSVNEIKALAKQAIASLCQTLEWDFGAMWMVDPTKQVLYYLEHWTNPQFPQTGLFAQEIKNLTFTKGEGLPGRAWEAMMTYWMEDVTKDPLLTRNELARKAGLCSAFAFPIFHSKNVIAIIECYNRKEEQLSQELYELLYSLGIQIGQFIRRKETEEALHDRNKLLQAIMDASYLPILATDINGMIILFNHAAESKLGYAAKEIIRKKSIDIFYKKNELLKKSQDLTNLLKKPIKPNFESTIVMLEHVNVDEQEWTYMGKGDMEFPVKVAVTALRNPAAQIDGYLYIFQDLTEQIKVDKIKKDFISTISHELRTPLTVIHGSLRLLTAGLENAEITRAKELALIAQKSSERLIMLINDFLDLRNFETGQMKFELQELDLKSFIEEAVAQNRIFEEKFDVKFVIKKSIKNIKIVADKMRLMKVMTNLLSNAAKFSFPKQTVTIITTINNNIVRVSIVDKGPGIPENFYEHIFDQFSQADLSAKPKAGVGLGLNMSKIIIQQMGGEIGFSSKLNQGSTFFFELPIVNS